MSTYSKALRHIDMKDVKKKHQQKLIEQKIQKKLEREEKKYIQSVMETVKYDWRKELNEQMTTSDMFFTTLPATGDVNLLSPPLNSSGSHNASIVGGTITLSGDPSPYATNGAFLNFDARQYDTLKFNVSIPPGAILGFLDLSGGSTNVLLAVLSSGTYTLTIPPNLRTSNFELVLDTPDSVTMSVSNFSFQRRTPMNVFVSLSSPEATAFIRTEPNLSNLSPQEKQQKLKEMLEASDEYVMKILGVDFPGTGAVPPGEFDPYAQAPPGEAGDTPGVEIAGLPPGMYPFNPMGGQAPAPKGYKTPGTYDPNQFYNLGPNTLPSPNLPSTPPGLSQGVNQDTQIAATYPQDPKWMRDLQKEYDKVKNKPNSPGTPKPGRGLGDTWEGPVRNAHYEPQGQLISERRKLKSPEEVLNKIPGYYDGKPAPLGFPVEQPPKMVNGMHPDLVDGKKVSDRFNRLDPESAKATPLTGNPHIDKKIKAARKKPK